MTAGRCRGTGLPAALFPAASPSLFLSERQRRETELPLEEFDEMRDIVEPAFVADLGDRLVGRNHQKPRMQQPLPDDPPVGRLAENPLEIVFERCEAFVGSQSQLFDREVLEDRIADDAFERIAEPVDALQEFVLQAVLLVSDHQISELGQFEPHELRMPVQVVRLHIGVQRVEKELHLLPRPGADMGERRIRPSSRWLPDVHSVERDQGREGVGNHPVVERQGDFAVLSAVRGQVFDVMLPRRHQEHLARPHRIAAVRILDRFGSGLDQTDPVFGQFGPFGAASFRGRIPLQNDGAFPGIFDRFR